MSDSCLEPVIVAIGLRQTVANVGQTDAGRLLRPHRMIAVRARAGVGDGDDHAVDLPARLDRDVGAFLLRRHRIFDRILDQRLEQQRGQPRPSTAGSMSKCGRSRSSKRIFSISR